MRKTDPKGVSVCNNCPKQVDLCGASTFDDKYEKGHRPQAKDLAPTSDCEQLAQFFEDEGQWRTWLFVWANLDKDVDATKFNTIKSIGNCGIAIRAASDDGECPSCAVAMGNQDAADVIRTSLDTLGKKGEGGKLFATGSTHCNARKHDQRGSDREVEWMLYNPY